MYAPRGRGGLMTPAIGPIYVRGSEDSPTNNPPHMFQKSVVQRGFCNRECDAMLFFLSPQTAPLKRCCSAPSETLSLPSSSWFFSPSTSTDSL